MIGRVVRTEFMLPPDEVSQRFAAQLAHHQVAALRERHRIVGGNDLLAKGWRRVWVAGCAWARR